MFKVMKIDVKTNAKYVLSVGYTEALLKEYIIPAYPEFSFEVTKSPVSESIYVHAQGEFLSKTIRISNHKNHQRVSSCIVTPTTKKSIVVHFIANALNQLKHNELEEIFNLI